MGSFRFRRSVGIGPFRVNLSKTGVSLTAGVPGAHVNFDLSGRRKHPVATVGLPGTGLSYQTQLGDSKPHHVVGDRQPPQPDFNNPRVQFAFKRALEVAAEGQPQDMRDILVFLSLQEQKYWHDDNFVLLCSVAARQQFPHMTEQQLGYAVALLNHGVGVAKKELEAQDAAQKAQDVAQDARRRIVARVVLFVVGIVVLCILASARH